MSAEFGISMSEEYDEECTEASDTDAVDVVIADKLLAVGNLIQACCVLDLKNRVQQP